MKFYIPNSKSFFLVSSFALIANVFQLEIELFVLRGREKLFPSVARDDFFALRSSSIWIDFGCDL